MTTRPFYVKWKGEDTLFGRPLFEWENVDYWGIDPITSVISPPRKFGYRHENEEPEAPKPADASDSEETTVV
jgi:hypothetical protein